MNKTENNLGKKNSTSYATHPAERTVAESNQVERELQAYNEGKRAFYEPFFFRSFIPTPYPKGTYLYKAWVQGYQDAEAFGDIPD
jgi:hypothetical protein